jgi:hypothetical protein
MLGALDDETSESDDRGRAVAIEKAAFAEAAARAVALDDVNAEMERAQRNWFLNTPSGKRRCDFNRRHEAEALAVALEEDHAELEREQRNWLLNTPEGKARCEANRREWQKAVSIEKEREEAEEKDAASDYVLYGDPSCDLSISSWVRTLHRHQGSRHRSHRHRSHRRT